MYITKRLCMHQFSFPLQFTMSLRDRNYIIVINFQVLKVLKRNYEEQYYTNDYYFPMQHWHVLSATNL